jgi:hypothetical protein
MAWAPGAPSGPCSTVARLGGIAAQRADRAGPAQYYSGPQTRPAGSVVPAEDSERIAMPSRCTGTKDASPPCDPVLLFASQPAALAAAARKAFQVQATGRQHVVRRQTCALVGPRLRVRDRAFSESQFRVKNERCNINILIRTVYPHYKRNHVPGDARTSSNWHSNSQELRSLRLFRMQRKKEMIYYSQLVRTGNRHERICSYFQ